MIAKLAGIRVLNNKSPTNHRTPTINESNNNQWIKKQKNHLLRADISLIHKGDWINFDLYQTFALDAFVIKTQKC